MKGNRSAWIGLGVGLALGMPLFEVFLLTILAIDGGLFHTAYTVRYLSNSANVFALLVILHLITAVVGAVAGLTVGRMKKRRRLRAIPGRAR